MDTILAFLMIDEDIREKRTRHGPGFIHKVLNEYDDDEWERDFRMTKVTYYYIKRALEDYWNGYMAMDHVLLCYLYAISTGECFRSLASRFSMSPTSVWNVLSTVGRLIIEHLKFQISYNISLEEANIQKFLFGRSYNQPDAVAAMDGCFCPIKKPVKDGEQYYNRHKKQYGMTMLAVVDYNARFLYVLAGNSGKVGDSLIFNTSSLKRDIESGNTVFDADNCILCDSAFSNLEYIIKSTQRIGSGSARAVVEHAFGQFKSQFRLFSTRSELSPKQHTILLASAVIVYNTIKSFQMSRVEIE